MAVGGVARAGGGAVGGVGLWADLGAGLRSEESPGRGRQVGLGAGPGAVLGAESGRGGAGGGSEGRV